MVNISGHQHGPHQTVNTCDHQHGPHQTIRLNQHQQQAGAEGDGTSNVTGSIEVEEAITGVLICDCVGE
eukprot:1137619-Pelagomonas_calceolata.AAC.1